MAEFYLSPLCGFLVRFAYWAGVVFALGTEITAVAVYMRFWFPAVPGWMWIVGFTLVLVLVNAFNVRLFGAVEYSFSAFKVTAIIAFLLLGAWVVFSASATHLSRMPHPSASLTTRPSAASFRKVSGGCGSPSWCRCSATSR